MPRSSLSPISSLRNELHAPAHLTNNHNIEQFRYSKQFTSGKHELYFTIAREQAACKCFQKRNLVLRLQVVTTACNFSALPRSSKGWRGKDLWGGTQSSPKLLSPSLALMQASQKELENRQAKLLLFKSGVIQILKLAGDWLLNPENYTIPKMG